MDTARIAYTYTVLRYVHDVGTQEFINVGVVALVNGVQLHAKFKISYGRVKRFFPAIDSDAYKLRMQLLQRRFDALAEGSLLEKTRDAATAEKRLERLVQSVVWSDDSSLQWSSIGSGTSKSLPAVLASLYSRYVSKHDVENTARRKDEDIWKNFRVELEHRQVLPYLEPKTIAVPDDSVEFKHAWKNGVWRCYEPLSFDLASEPTIKEKAHRWLGQLNSVQQSADHFTVYFLVGKPSDTKLIPAFQNAMSVLQKAKAAQIVHEEDAAEFSAGVASEILQSIKDHNSDSASGR